MTQPLRHTRPSDLGEALAALTDGGTPYVGGTELVAAMKLGLLAPEHLVDLKGLPELRGIELEGPVLHIGAATPHAVAERDHLVRATLPVLSTALRSIGNPRVRWQGTLGGNLCFAEPRSDLIPVLIALDAALSLKSVRGERTVRAADFVTDAFVVDRGDDELLLRISIDTDGLRYQQYSRIQHVERPTAGLAIVHRRGQWRLCVGSVGYVPYLTTTDALKALSPAAIADAVEPIEDAAGSAEYKRHLVQVLVSRALAEAGAAA
jgi:aerobic carbon-monoxide dehydrogenase medium subunit